MSEEIYIPEEYPTKPIEEFREYENNPVSHTKRQKQEVKDSIREFGFLIPMLVRDESGEIADGHLRLEVGQEYEMKKLPYISVDHLNEEQIRALRIMLQKSAYDGEFMETRLATELEDLTMEELDISLTGFTDEEVDDILRDIDIDEFFEEEKEEEDEGDEQPEIVECPECGHRFEV